MKRIFTFRASTTELHRACNFLVVKVVLPVRESDPERAGRVFPPAQIFEGSGRWNASLSKGSGRCCKTLCPNALSADFPRKSAVLPSINLQCEAFGTGGCG